MCKLAPTIVAVLQKIIERGQAVEGPPGPIIVCTRNNDLQGVLDSTPEDRREGIDNGLRPISCAAAYSVQC